MHRLPGDAYLSGKPLLLNEEHSRQPPDVVRDLMKHRLADYITSRQAGSVRLEVVFKLLGHRSTEVTEQPYAELLDQTIRKEMLTALSG